MFRIWRGDGRIGRTRIESSELQAAFDGFRAAVRKEDAVHPGDFGELLGKRALEFVVKEIGQMNGATGFAANHFDDIGVSVAEAVDRDTAEKIEIFFPVGIENVRPAAMRKDERLALVGWKKILLGIGQRSGRD